MLFVSSRSIPREVLLLLLNDESHCISRQQLHAWRRHSSLKILSAVAIRWCKRYPAVDIIVQCAFCRPSGLGR